MSAATWGRVSGAALGVTLAAVLLSGCGFRPLYAPRSGGEAAAARLAGVDLAAPETRLAQLVYRNLVALMAPASGPKGKASHRLEIRVVERQVGLAVRGDDSVTRINLTMSGHFKLFEQGAEKSVLAGESRAVAAMNVVQSDFANLIAERDARARAARSLARDIVNRLAVYLAAREADG